MTGRPRRCGWFDAVAVRHAARVSGSTELAVMLLDVFSGIDELKVAVAYERGRRADQPSCPASLPDFEQCRPIYETLPGWNEDLTDDQAMVRPAQRRHGSTSSSSADRWACPCRSSRSAPTAADDPGAVVDRREAEHEPGARQSRSSCTIRLILR